MSLGDKAVALFCLFALGWYVGREERNAEVRAMPISCSPWKEGGRPLIKSIHEASGRVLCLYADPMPRYAKRDPKGLM